MDAERAGEELKVIRQLMERPVRYSTQSGLAGIIAGCAALAGLAADWHISGRFAHDAEMAMWINMGVWAGVFVVAFLAVTVLTRLRERAVGMPFWSPVKARILRTILPAFVAGAGMTLIIVFDWHRTGDGSQWALIPPVWMLFYGVALWQLGEFAVGEIRALGTAFILAGLAAAALGQSYPYLALGVTFGGFHLVYGAIVWMRHGG